MSALYGAYQRGVDADPSRAPGHATRDFAVWHRDWMAGPELARQLAFWREHLAGAPDALELPTDYPRPPTQSGDGATAWLSLPPRADARRSARSACAKARRCS